MVANFTLLIWFNGKSCLPIYQIRPTLVRPYKGVITYEFVLAFPTLLRMSCSFYLNSLWDEKQAAVLLLLFGMLLPGFVQDNPKHSCIAFSLSVLLAPMWCIHIVVLKQLQHGRSHILFRRIDQTSIWSIAVPIFAWRVLISFSVNEILLPRYVYWFTNFKGLPLRAEMAPFYLKYIYSVLFAEAIGHLRSLHLS